MAKKKSTRRRKFWKRGRRTAKRFRRSYNKRPKYIVNVPRSHITANKAFVKFRFSTVQRSFTTGPQFAVNFAGNSIWDPDQAIGGRTVAGHAIWGTLYSKYYVRGSKVTVLFLQGSQAGTTGNVPCDVFVQPATTSTVNPNTDINPLRDQPLMRVKRMGYSSGPYEMRKISYYMKTNKIFGRPKTKYDDDYASNWNANPTRLWYWNIGAASINGTSNVSLFYEISITYYTELRDRVDVATQS